MTFRAMKRLQDIELTPLKPLARQPSRDLVALEYEDSSSWDVQNHALL